MNFQFNLLKFPLWQYLTQPLFGTDTKLILNPQQFEVQHKILLLERCWCKEYDSKDSFFNT